MSSIRSSSESMGSPPAPSHPPSPSPRTQGDFFFEVIIPKNEVIADAGTASDTRFILIVSPSRRNYQYAVVDDRQKQVVQTTDLTLLWSVTRDDHRDTILCITRRGVTFPKPQFDAVHCRLPSKVDRDNLYDFLHGVAQKERLLLGSVSHSGEMNWAVSHFHYPLPSITLVGRCSHSGQWRWRDRWAILTTGRLLLFKTQPEVRDGTGSIPHLCIYLAHSTCEAKSNTGMIISAVHGKANLQFPSSAERDNWLTALSNELKSSTVVKTVGPPTPTSLPPSAVSALSSSKSETKASAAVGPAAAAAASAVITSPTSITNSVSTIAAATPTSITSAVGGEAYIYTLESYSDEYRTIERDFKASLSNHIECYVRDRVSAGQPPVAFRLVNISRVINPRLDAQFTTAKARLQSLGRDAKEMQIHHAYHGSSHTNLRLIANNGLLRVGHPQNPSTRIDDGYFGSTSMGIYVSQHADYCFKYANNLDPLLPPHQTQILMFDVLPGRSRYITEMTPGLIPTSGYDSHTSPRHMEWYLFNEDQCVPRALLTIEAYDNYRTPQDDETALPAAAAATLTPLSQLQQKPI